MSQEHEDTLGAVQPVTASCNAAVITARNFMLTNQSPVNEDELMIDQCLYQQVFGDEDISAYELQPVEENMPYIKLYEKLPPFLENSFYFRFKRNKIIFSKPWPDFIVEHYKVMASNGACGSVVICPTFTCVENKSFKQVFKHEVRVLKYEKIVDVVVSDEESLIACSSDVQRYPSRITTRVKSSYSNVLILHDFHEHPLLLGQLASEFYPKTVYIPYIHDILKLSYFSKDTILEFSVNILQGLFSQVYPVDAVGHGISCILMQELSNRLNIDNLIFCNPPARFKYVFLEEKMVTSEIIDQADGSVYTDSKYSGLQQLPQSELEFYRSAVESQRENDTERTKQAKSQSECVDKYYAIIASGNTEKLTCSYNEILERKGTMMTNKNDDVIQIESKNEIYKVVNDILARISSLQGSFERRYKIKKRYHCRKQLGFVLLQFTSHTFKEMIMNLLIFAPNAAIEQYIRNMRLFNIEFFEQMHKFYDLLTGEPPHITQDSVQKVVLFPSNSAYLEEQTVQFFKEVDDRDGDFFVRSIIGCGYDMFYCVPQIIANLLK